MRKLKGLEAGALEYKYLEVMHSSYRVIPVIVICSMLVCVICLVNYGIDRGEVNFVQSFRTTVHGTSASMPIRPGRTLVRPRRAVKYWGSPGTVTIENPKDLYFLCFKRSSTMESYFVVVIIRIPSSDAEVF